MNYGNNGHRIGGAKDYKRKNGMMSIKELSSKAGFEIGNTYMLCKSLENQGCIGFFSRSSCPG